MSALPPRADILFGAKKSAKCQKRTCQARKNSPAKAVINEPRSAYIPPAPSPRGFHLTKSSCSKGDVTEREVNDETPSALSSLCNHLRGGDCSNVRTGATEAAQYRRHLG